MTQIIAVITGLLLAFLIVAYAMRRYMEQESLFIAIISVAKNHGLVENLMILFISKCGFKKTKKIYIRFLRLLIFLEAFVVVASF